MSMSIFRMPHTRNVPAAIVGAASTPRKTQLGSTLYLYPQPALLNFSDLTPL